MKKKKKSSFKEMSAIIVFIYLCQEMCLYVGLNVVYSWLFMEVTLLETLICNKKKRGGGEEEEFLITICFKWCLTLKALKYPSKHYTVF